MFTGLVGPLGQVKSREGQGNEGKGEVRFTIDTPWTADSFVMGNPSRAMARI